MASGEEFFRHGDRLVTEPRVIAITGASGSGKTWLGERLSARLFCPRLAIDDYGKPGSTRWSSLLDAVRGIDGPVVVESCAVPRAYRKLITVTILRRLIERGESLNDADRMVRDCQRVPTSGDMEVRDAEVDDDTLDAIVAAVTGGYPSPDEQTRHRLPRPVGQISTLTQGGSSDDAIVATTAGAEGVGIHPAATKSDTGIPPAQNMRIAGPPFFAGLA
jgi:hypothetical protein